MKTFIDDGFRKNPCFNVPLLIEQLKRFWVIPAVTLLAYLLFVVLMLFTASQNSWNNPSRIMINILMMEHPVILVSSVLAPLCAAASLFPHHYSHPANTAFASLPISRRQLFVTNLAAGVLMFVIPLLILGLILLIPVRLTIVNTGWNMQPLSQWVMNREVFAGQVVNTPLAVGAFFLRAVLTSGFYFALGIMAVSVVGSRVIAGMIALAVSFLPVVVLGLGWVIAEFYVFGFSHAGAFFTDRVMLYMHPVSMGVLLNNSWRGGQFAPAPYGMWPFYLSHILLTAGMLAAGYFCYMRRKAERTGETVVFTPLKNIMVFILSLAGMGIGGVFFMAMFNGSRAGYYFGFVMGFALAYIIAQMIAEKSLHIWYKIKKLPLFGGIALGMYIMVHVITSGVMYGYTTHVPDMNNVAGVYIGIPIRSYSNEGRDFTFVTDRAVIGRTLAIHGQIVEERRMLRPLNTIGMWSSTSRWNTMSIERFTVTYRLNDGKMISRMYSLPRDFMQRSGAEALLREEAVILSYYPALLDTAFTSRIEIFLRGPAGQEQHPVVVYSRAQIESLTEALRRDTVRDAVNERQWRAGEIPWPNRDNPFSASVNIHRIINEDGRPLQWNRHFWFSEPVYTTEWLRREFPEIYALWRES
ncbi:MAG: ABC transporter permease [Defluviitaleaceae bacterium]|nr:ABC transporter permease [Defluviitaleaceae bacterium]